MLPLFHVFNITKILLATWDILISYQGVFIFCTKNSPSNEGTCFPTTKLFSYFFGTKFPLPLHPSFSSLYQPLSLLHSSSFYTFNQQIFSNSATSDIAFSFKFTHFLTHCIIPAYSNTAFLSFFHSSSTTEPSWHSRASHFSCTSFMNS